MSEANERPVSFNVSLDDSGVGKTSGQMPEKLKKRLSDHMPRPVTPDVLDEKQKAAEERRKAQEKARIERIQEREKECKKMCEKVTPIIEKDVNLTAPSSKIGKD
ncbi:uncharacterized protein LOC141899593 [Tubulanus polymorphus]|uniref:uncharacterized protein LOC141899593 n=1 Tax=Tubulanus polymorphus TaxID=672921 RepID=UPI003DA60A3B